MYGVNPVAHFWVVLHHIDGGKWQTPAVSVALEIQGHKGGSGTCCMFAGDFHQFYRRIQVHKPQTASTNCMESHKYFPRTVSWAGGTGWTVYKTRQQDCVSWKQRYRLFNMRAEMADVSRVFIFKFRGTAVQVERIQGKLHPLM